MKLIAQAMPQEAQATAPDDGALPEEASIDRDMASAMASLLLSNPKMLQEMQNMAKSGQAAGAGGMLAAQVIAGLREKLIQKGPQGEVDDRIWVAEGGVLDDVINEIGMNLVGFGGPESGVDTDIMRESALKFLEQYDASGEEAKAGGQQPGQPGALGAAMGSAVVDFNIGGPQ